MPRRQIPIRVGAPPRVRPLAQKYLERNAVTASGVAAAFEDEAELMSAVCVVQKRMDAYAVE